MKYLHVPDVVYIERLFQTHDEPLETETTKHEEAPELTPGLRQSPPQDTMQATVKSASVCSRLSTDGQTLEPFALAPITLYAQCTMNSHRAT